MSEPLSYAESLKFVKEELQIENSETLLHTDRYELLRQITRRLQVHSPFHNFFLMAQDPENRHTPSWEEIKYRMLTGAGGLCYPKNLFLFYLLRVFRFQVNIVMADMLIPPNADMKHVVLIVQNVKTPGDRYMVDVGILWPFQEPVHLNFEKESPEVTQSHFIIKYIKEGQKIIRLQRTSKERNHGYTRLYEMSLEEWDPCQVGEYMDRIYKTTYQHVCILHQLLSCVQYDNKGNVKLLQDNVFKRHMDDGNFVKLSIDNDDALIDCVLDNFPKVSKDIVVKAVMNWRHVCSNITY